MEPIRKQTVGWVEHPNDGFGSGGGPCPQTRQARRQLGLADPLLGLALRGRRLLDQLELAEALHKFGDFDLRPRRHGVGGGRRRRGRVHKASHRAVQRGAARVQTGGFAVYQEWNM